FAASHEEYAGNAASVKNLALGDAEYYKSVETEEGHSLYISDYSDLVAAVRYYDQVNNSLYMEFMIDPSYDVLSGAYPDLHKAFRAVDGRNATVQYSNGTVLIVYFIV
ncbi:MAG TPA: hypothetical protein DIC18_01480, partial [Clostridiales bacterium]|nr:hypothetical protein [Clostridiales bacterium]